MTTVPSGAYTENTIALAPLAPLLPLLDFVHANFFTTDAPDTVKVRSIVPFRTVAPPRVALAAKDSTTDPALEAVAAVLLFTVTPEGSVPTVQVQATCAMPKYPIKGMVISVAAATRPPEVQAIFCASFPRMIESPPVPAAPGSPWEPS